MEERISIAMQTDMRLEFRGARWRLMLGQPAGGVPRFPLTDEDLAELENEAGMATAKDGGA